MGNLDHTIARLLSRTGSCEWTSARRVASVVGVVHGGRQEGKSREGSCGKVCKLWVVVAGQEWAEIREAAGTAHGAAEGERDLALCLHLAWLCTLLSTLCTG